jgi:hypothetical protein
MYTIMIAAIPILTAAVLMTVLAWFLAQSPEQLAAWGAGAGTDPTTAHYDVHQIRHARAIGWMLWAFMFLLHAVPVRLFRESVGRTQRRWDQLLALRPDIPRFESLAPHPFAPEPATPAPPTSPEPHDQSNITGQ